MLYTRSPDLCEPGLSVWRSRLWKSPAPPAATHTQNRPNRCRVGAVASLPVTQELAQAGGVGYNWKRAVIKLATIQRAEGEREAAIKVAEGRAEAIRLVNEAAQNYFQGNAQTLKQMEMTETSLRDNAKVVITEKGISPTLLLGSLPFAVTPCRAATRPPG